nr:vegetative cell wall protein gp1-like [Aegilops tauschii subsp. strangulata]
MAPAPTSTRARSGSTPLCPDDRAPPPGAARRHLPRGLTARPRRRVEPSSPDRPYTPSSSHATPLVSPVCPPLSPSPDPARAHAHDAPASPSHSHLRPRTGYAPCVRPRPPQCCLLQPLLLCYCCRC